MKKQFFRVKQLADQTFSRAEKTNILSDDLQDADRKADYVKNTCQIITKKIAACHPLGTNQGDAVLVMKDKDKEKAHKKSPECQLSSALKECSGFCDDNSPLRLCLQQCSEVQKVLADDNIERDSIVEAKVVAQLQVLLDSDIPSIAKQKRNLNKLCLDMDSARARYSQAAKHSGATSTGASKAESVKEELEDSEIRLEQGRDALACEMFKLICKEADLCRYMLEYYKYRREYYSSALRHLDQLLPSLETIAGDSSVKVVYGTKLEEHLRVSKRTIAFPIELCICALLELGLDEEGLFRVAGGASKVKRMKLSMDAGCMTLETALAYRDPHVIAGCLKSYLRELPEPLMTFALYDEWLEAAKGQSAQETDRIQKIRAVIQKLPPAQFDNLRYLMRFFNLLSKKEEVNKMSPHNLAIVLAPSLMSKDSDDTGLFLNASLYATIVEILIRNCDCFFAEMDDFYRTFERISNGEQDGIDNKGFDPRILEGGMKRSQSVDSLTDEAPSSPKPEARKRNKPAAPVPPSTKNGPEKPPRPAAIATSTLPRPTKAPREHKSTETDALMTHSMGSAEILFRNEANNESRHRHKNDIEKKPKIKATVATNTESFQKSENDYKPRMHSGGDETSSDSESRMPNARPIREAETATPSRPETATPSRQELESKQCAKEKWLLGKDDVSRKPAIPERPAALKPTGFKALRNAFDTPVRNYENVSRSSNENLSGDERTLQKTQIYSIEKQQIAIIDVNDKKRDRSREKHRDRDGDSSAKTNAVTVIDNNSENDESGDIVRGPPQLRRKASLSDSMRPLSLSGFDKAEHITSPSSHMRTLSDGQIIDRVHKQDVNANEGNKQPQVIKHPSTSPPPPPPPKPRAHSQRESTDF